MFTHVEPIIWWIVLYVDCIIKDSVDLQPPFKLITVPTIALLLLHWDDRVHMTMHMTESIWQWQSQFSKTCNSTQLSQVVMLDKISYQTHNYTVQGNSSKSVSNRDLFQICKDLKDLYLKDLNLKDLYFPRLRVNMLE